MLKKVATGAIKLSLFVAMLKLRRFLFSQEIRYTFSEETYCR